MLVSRRALKRHKNLDQKARLLFYITYLISMIVNVSKIKDLLKIQTNNNNNNIKHKVEITQHFKGCLSWSQRVRMSKISSFLNKINVFNCHPCLSCLNPFVRHCYSETTIKLINFQIEK